MLMKSNGIARRDFLERLAIVMATLPAALRAATDHLPIGFSTLGCPSWDWTRILDFAQQNGFASVELRGLAGTMDLPARPEYEIQRGGARRFGDLASRLGAPYVRVFGNKLVGLQATAVEHIAASLRE